MKKQLEIINTTFEKIVPKKESNDANFWSFLTTSVSTFFAFSFIIFFMLFLHPFGWLSIIIMTLLYKFVIS
jgi:hypothetical protein